MLADWETDDSTDELDWWMPGSFVEVKAKNQPISNRWPLPCAEPDAFILDELSVRKALAHFPHAYFVFLDHPLQRVFVARVDEVICGPGNPGTGDRPGAAH